MCKQCPSAQRSWMELLVVGRPWNRGTELEAERGGGGVGRSGPRRGGQSPGELPPWAEESGL